MLASPVGLIVPLVSTTTFVSSRIALEAQETKVRVTSLFLRHGILFGLRRMLCLLLLYLRTFQVIRHPQKEKGMFKEFVATKRPTSLNKIRSKFCPCDFILEITLMDPHPPPPYST
jgi:hypothetical protein